jgi:hypothetical protein
MEYCQGDIIMFLTGHNNCKEILVGTFGYKRLFGRPRCRWERNVKISLKDTGPDNMDGIRQPQSSIQRNIFKVLSAHESGHDYAKFSAITKRHFN